MRHVRKSASAMSQELQQRDISCQTANGDEFIGLEEKLRMIDHAYAQVRQFLNNLKINNVNL